MTIEELKGFYHDRELPRTVELMQGVKLADVPKFVDSHFTVLMANPVSKASNPFQVRLILLKELLEAEK